MPNIDYPTNPNQGDSATYSNGSYVVWDGYAWRAPSITEYGSFGITIDAGTQVIGTGSKGYVTMPYAGALDSWDIVSNTIGNIQIDLKKSPYDTFPTTTSITSGNYIGMTNSQKSTDITLTGWGLTFSENDVYEFVVVSSATMSRANIVIKTVKYIN
jgi:hypothetical protein